MGLFDILKRYGAASAGLEHAIEARLRAKRRLIGAVVLLGIGVVAFPLLFETQPRPIPVDIPIQIPSRESAPPLALPPPAKVGAAASMPAPKVAVAPAPVPPAETAPPKVAAPAEPAPPAAPKSTPPKAEAALRPAPTASSPPPAAPKPAAAEANGRFVVQVGAFAEASAVREARSKVEKLGLSSYTQQVDTSNGPRTRVRLGPFATREEADKAAAKLKAAGLPGAVLAL